MQLAGFPLSWPPLLAEVRQLLLFVDASTFCAARRCAASCRRSTCASAARGLVLFLEPLSALGPRRSHDRCCARSTATLGDDAGPRPLSAYGERTFRRAHGPPARREGRSCSPLSRSCSPLARRLLLLDKHEMSDLCTVCDEPGTLQCAACKTARFCSTRCQSLVRPTSSRLPSSLDSDADSAPARRSGQRTSSSAAATQTFSASRRSRTTSSPSSTGSRSASSGATVRATSTSSRSEMVSTVRSGGYVRSLSDSPSS